MRHTVERIADSFAVLEREDMRHIVVELKELPADIKEGNILFFNGEVYTVDSEGESETRKRIAEKQKSIFRKN